MFLLPPPGAQKGVWPWRIPATRALATVGGMGAIWGSILALAAWKLGAALEWQVIIVGSGLAFGAIGAQRTCLLILTALSTDGWIGPMRLRDDTSSAAAAVLYSIGGILLAGWFIASLQWPAVLGVLLVEAGTAVMIGVSAAEVVAIRHFEGTRNRRVLVVRTATQRWFALEGSRAAPPIPVREPSHGGTRPPSKGLL